MRSEIRSPWRGCSTSCDARAIIDLNSDIRPPQVVADEHKLWKIACRGGASNEIRWHRSRSRGGSFPSKNKEEQLWRQRMKSLKSYRANTVWQRFKAKPLSRRCLQRSLPRRSPATRRHCPASENSRWRPRRNARPETPQRERRSRFPPPGRWPLCQQRPWRMRWTARKNGPAPRRGAIQGRDRGTHQPSERITSVCSAVLFVDRSAAQNMRQFGDPWSAGISTLPTSRFG